MGFINEVKRKDGCNEMNDLTANGRKELKRKEGSNQRGGVLKPEEGSNKRNRRVAMKQTCSRKDSIGIDTNGRTSPHERLETKGRST